MIKFVRFIAKFWVHQFCLVSDPGQIWCWVIIDFLAATEVASSGIPLYICAYSSQCPLSPITNQSPARLPRGRGPTPLFGSPTHPVQLELPTIVKLGASLTRPSVVWLTGESVQWNIQTLLRTLLLVFLGLHGITYFCIYLKYLHDSSSNKMNCFEHLLHSLLTFLFIQVENLANFVVATRP